MGFSALAFDIVDFASRMAKIWDCTRFFAKAYRFAASCFATASWGRYSFAMTDAPDLDQLARRYLDLWQQQVTAWLNEPEVADAMAKAYLMMIEGIASLAEAAGLTAPAARPGAGHNHDTNRGPKAQAEKDARKDDPRGTAAVAPASGDADRDARLLARRVAELEERIARLESAAASGRRAPARRHRPNRR
jgi:hypothetical protein